jgi:uncharacterized membrane-anchored protein YhcB (DUF1043 family)
MTVYLYIICSFVAGFIIAWVIRTITLLKLKKEYKSTQGLLESEKLRKETSQKENSFLIQSADATLLITKEKLRKAEDLVRIMDNDILLLQKSNEETENLFAKAEPALHEMKLKLIEANNNVARLKKQLGEK